MTDSASSVFAGACMGDNFGGRRSGAACPPVVSAFISAAVTNGQFRKFQDDPAYARSSGPMDAVPKDQYPTGTIRAITAEARRAATITRYWRHGIRPSRTAGG